MKDECQQPAIETRSPTSSLIWRVVAASVCGTSHQKRSQPCQDDHFWHSRNDGVLIAAVADGAGSASLGEVGAQIAVRTAVERLEAVDFCSISIESASQPQTPAEDSSADPISEDIPEGIPDAQPDVELPLPHAEEVAISIDSTDSDAAEELAQTPPETPDVTPDATPDAEVSPIRLLLADALESARQAVEAQAQARQVPVRELASTLIVVVATPEWVAAGQVGDGAAVVCDRNGQIFPLTVPKSGEYINETTFLISPNARASAQFHLWQGTAAQVAMFSDGLQLLALEMPAGTPHAPFFTPLFRFVAQEELSDDGATEQLENFLQSPRVTQRTDDDLTLLLATLKGDVDRAGSATS